MASWERPEYRAMKALVEGRLPLLMDGASARGSKALADAMRYSLLAPGKRLRPVLLLLCCKACGGQAEEALPFACAIEMVHCYSLIHDDLPCMDDDDLRRGMPTSHKVYGEGMAVLAGDGLLSLAFETLHEDYALCSGEPEKLRRHTAAGRMLAEACGACGMVAGQAEDLAAEGKAVPGEALDFIHVRKTAALIRAAAGMGAVLGGAAEEDAREYAAYGESLGLAFQVADDILDVTGDTQVIGKTAGKDAAQQKATYPAVYGLAASRVRLAELTERAACALGRARGDAAAIGMLSGLARELETRAK